MHSAIIRKGPAGRSFAYRLVDCAPEGSIVEVKPPRRTIPQNDRLWAMLLPDKPSHTTKTPKLNFNPVTMLRVFMFMFMFPFMSTCAWPQPQALVCRPILIGTSC